MKKIEGMLNDVAQVFSRLGTMVRMQETMVDRYVVCVVDIYEPESINIRKNLPSMWIGGGRSSKRRTRMLVRVAA